MKLSHCFIVFSLFLLFGCSNQSNFVSTTSSLITSTTLSPISETCESDSVCSVPQQEDITNNDFPLFISDARAIISFEANALSTSTIMKDGVISSTKIDGKRYVKGDKGFSDLTITSPEDQIFKARIYSDKSIIITCLSVEDLWVCNETKTITSLWSKDIYNFWEILYNKRAMHFFGKEVINVYSKECTKVNAQIDLNLLSNQEKYTLLALSGLSQVQNPDSYIPLMKEFVVRWCPKDGISLKTEYSLTLEKDGKQTIISSESTVTDYQINKDLSDSLFVIPS